MFWQQNGLVDPKEVPFSIVWSFLWVKGLSTTTYNLKKLVRQALMSRTTSSHRIGEVDAAVTVRTQEEGKGRDERRK